MNVSTIHRLALDCGHVAFALDHEEHVRTRRRPCFACNEDGNVWPRILRSTPTQCRLTEEAAA